MLLGRHPRKSPQVYKSVHGRNSEYLPHSGRHQHARGAMAAIPAGDSSGHERCPRPAPVIALPAIVYHFAVLLWRPAIDAGWPPCETRKCDCRRFHGVPWPAFLGPSTRRAASNGFSHVRKSDALAAGNQAWWPRTSIADKNYRESRSGFHLQPRVLNEVAQGINANYGHDCSAGPANATENMKFSDFTRGSASFRGSTTYLENRVTPYEQTSQIA